MKNTNVFQYLLIIPALALVSFQANAVLIDFDDLPTFVEPDSDEDCNQEPPFPTANCVGDEYQSLGVIFEGAVVVGVEDGDYASAPNAVYDISGPDIWLTFMGELPDIVSFDVWTLAGEAAFADAYAGGKSVAHVETITGYKGDDSDPDLIGERLTLSASDIERVSIRGLFNRRGHLHMDNLYFEDTDAATVPEPNLWSLFAIALVLIVLRSANRQRPSVLSG